MSLQNKVADIQKRLEGMSSPNSANSVMVYAYLDK